MPVHEWLLLISTPPVTFDQALVAVNFELILSYNESETSYNESETSYILT